MAAGAALTHPLCAHRLRTTTTPECPGWFGCQATRLDVLVDPNRSYAVPQAVPLRADIAGVNRWWRAYLAGGALIVAVYLGIPEGIPRDVVYVAVGLSCAAAIVVGVRRNRPARGAPWYWMAVGQLCWVAEDALYAWYTDVEHISPFPSGADALYLVAYPLFAVGFVLLIRTRRAHRLPRRGRRRQHRCRGGS